MIDKIYLKKHLHKREELKNEQERYALLESRITPKSQQLDGLPHAPSGSRNAGYINDSIKKIDLEKKIEELDNTIRKEYQLIDNVIEKLDYPDEKMVLKMRYFDCWEWPNIRALMYSKRKDYYENIEKYNDKVFKVHSAALKHIKEIQEAAKANEKVGECRNGEWND